MSTTNSGTLFDTEYEETDSLKVGSTFEVLTNLTCDSTSTVDPGDTGMVQVESALVWAARLESHPVYEVNGVIIRMLHALFQTDFVAADGCKVLVQRLRILTSSRQMMEGGHLLWEVQALALAEDLTRLRQLREEIAPLAERYPAWRPVLHYAIGEYHRIRRAGQPGRGRLVHGLGHHGDAS